MDGAESKLTARKTVEEAAGAWYYNHIVPLFIEGEKL